MVDKKFQIHRDLHAKTCKHCGTDFRTFVRTQDYCKVRCRYEAGLETARQQKAAREAAKSAKQKETERILAEQKEARRLRREGKTTPKARTNNTPHKPKPATCGEVKMRPCLGKFCGHKEFLTDAANRICPSCTHKNNNAITGPDEYRVIVETRKTGSNY
jgi:hypothetical protein